MPHTKLSPEDRRAIVLALLQGETAIDVSKRFGIARSRVYALKEEATRDAIGKREQAWREWHFYCEVLRLTKGEKG